EVQTGEVLVRPGGQRGAAAGEQLVQAVAVQAKAVAGVVGGGAGGDEERPVGGGEEEELRERGAGALGRQRRERVVDRVLGAAEVLPHPGGGVVHPDAVVALLAPRAFVEGDARLRSVRRELARGRTRGHRTAFWTSFERPSEHLLEPGDAFEPPVAEELGVV